MGETCSNGPAARPPHTIGRSPSRPSLAFTTKPPRLRRSRSNQSAAGQRSTSETVKGEDCRTVGGVERKTLGSNCSSKRPRASWLTKCRLRARTTSSGFAPHRRCRGMAMLLSDHPWKRAQFSTLGTNQTTNTQTINMAPTTRKSKTASRSRATGGKSHQVRVSSSIVRPPGSSRALFFSLTLMLAPTRTTRRIEQHEDGVKQVAADSHHGRNRSTSIKGTNVG